MFVINASETHVCDSGIRDMCYHLDFYTIRTKVIFLIISRFSLLVWLVTQLLQNTNFPPSCHGNWGEEGI